MRTPGIIETTAAEALWLEAQEIEEHCRQRRQGWEARYGPRTGCPYGCDGSGWRPIEDWDGTLYPFELIQDGMAYTWCECNGRLVWDEEEYVPVPARPFRTG